MKVAEKKTTKPLTQMDLAFERTYLAVERTLMAWVRTATSLIAFGFSVYKFFQLEKTDGLLNQSPIGPRFFGMTMIFVGLVSLALATGQHWHYKMRLKQQGIEVPFSLAGLVAGLISLLGIVAMIAVIFKL
jgi:putative membrane protein